MTAFAAFLLYNVSSAIAQDASPSPAASATPSASPSPDGNQGQGRWNPQEFRQRMEDRLKTDLKTTEAEWAVIQPLLEKVMEKQRATFAGRFGGRRGGGQGGGQSSMPEADALRTALESDQTSNDDLKAKLAALREARKKAGAELDQAREDLKKVLTLRQEAMLVSRGILE